MRKCLFYLLWLLMPVSLYAQTQIVSGKVTSPEKEPLPGMNILVIGTSTGTTTNGDYSITVPIAAVP